MPQGSSRSRSTSVVDASTRRNLSDDERIAAYQLFLEHSLNGELLRVRSANNIKIAIKAVPHEGRKTLLSTAAKSGIPKSTILRHIKKSTGLKAGSSQVKPLVTDYPKAARIRLAMSFLQPQLRKDHVFDVHVDEKWFCVTKVKRTLYLYDDEVLAERAAKCITKVVFLAVVVRPRYDPHKKKMFDGKIGICPFDEKVVALCTSKNRSKGVLELKAQNVDVQARQDMIMNEVVSAIQGKMPRHLSVRLQQDNASPPTCVTTKLIAQLSRGGI
ncbi:hypothetical protein B5M09_010885 [Aphanomyces astaci]|uniref:Uncharacterized protein n=1 Tax=Aphanomyces astaci TaxID=112090 RepID=A0A3R7YEB8_APHAT|nr:hypothetical protein B5M09_010885 [Aphanomyces astaci]